MRMILLILALLLHLFPAYNPRVILSICDVQEPLFLAVEPLFPQRRVGQVRFSREISQVRHFALEEGHFVGIEPSPDLNAVHSPDLALRFAFGLYDE